MTGRPSTHHQQGDTVTDKPYTDADVLDLQDVIADARIRGIGTGTYSMARAILEAGYRLPAEHHLPLLALDAGEVACADRCRRCRRPWLVGIRMAFRYGQARGAPP